MSQLDNASAHATETGEKGGASAHTEAASRLHADSYTSEKSSNVGGSKSSDPSFSKGSWVEGFKAVGDVAKAGGELLISPVDSLYEGIKGEFKYAGTGLSDLAHGDIGSGLGHLIAAPFVGGYDAAKTGLEHTGNAGEDLLKAGDHVGKSVVQNVEGLVDYAKAAGDIAITPFTSTYASMKGTLQAEADGASKMVHGDVLGGAGEIVIAPLKGMVDGVKDVASRVGDAATNVWHGLEHIF